MVELVNRSGQRSVDLRVTSDGEAIHRTVTLASGGGVTDAFVDVPRLGRTLSVSVKGSGAADGAAWLALQGDAATVAATPGAPTALRRMADVYNEAQASASGREMLVSDHALPAQQAGVWVVGGAPSPPGATTVVDHPVTDGVTAWAAAVGVMPDGFVPVVMRNGRASVAIRGGATRQVWASLDLDRASATADWVVFLSNAFRWAGGADSRYIAELPRPLGAGWTRDASVNAPNRVEAGLWPGLYRSTDGRVVAINAPLREPAAVDEGLARQNLPAAGGPTRGGALLVAAVACIAIGAAVWPGRRGLGC